MRFSGFAIFVAGALAMGGDALANAQDNGATIPSEAIKAPALNVDAPPEGPIQIIVSVPDQHVKVFAGSKLVASSPVSTGRKGHSTPTGVFSILQKKKFHRSNIYSRAPMPFMQRLTWSGIALHGSDHVPDYPASHGCVRLPPKFAKKLFGFTEMGGHVVISGDESAPAEISHPNLFQPAALRRLAAAPAKSEIDGSRSSTMNMGVTTPEAENLVVEVSANETLSRNIGTETKQTRIDSNRDISPLRILVTRRTGRELVRDVQSLLTDLGFDPGAVDGWMGRDTGAAIIRFQESRDLQTTGAMSMDLVRELYSAAGKGEPPTGHIYVRQNFKPVFDAPIAIADSELPLGAHLFTAMDFEEGATEVRWLAVSLKDVTQSALSSQPDDEEVPVLHAQPSAEKVLDRIEIPKSVRRRISAMLTPGSSLAVSDEGISIETIDKGTDFVVLTRR